MTADPPEALKNRLVAQAATLFDVHDNVSRVIRDINFPTEELHDEYSITSSKTFDFEPMLRVYLYRQITGYSQSEVADRLQKWPYLKQHFNLSRVPTQQAISYTERKRFSHGLRQLIGDVADGICNEARDHGIRSSQLREPDTNPSPSEISESSTPLHHYVDKHAPGVITTALDDVCPAFDTGRAHNVKHEDRTIWEHQLLMSLSDRAGTRSAFRTFNKFRSDALHNDTHLRSVKKLGTPDAYQYTFEDFVPGFKPIPSWRRVADTIQPQFSGAVGRLLETVKSTGVFTEPVVVAIDTIRVPYSVSPYKPRDEEEPGDEHIVVDKEKGIERVPKANYPEMINGRKGEGPAYEYATLSIVGRNDPIILAVEPVRHSSTWEGEDGESVSWAEIVDRLMQQATELVDIHLVLADREFDNHEVAHVLDQYHDVTYLLPKKKNSKLTKQEVDEVKYDPTLKSRVRPATLYLDENRTRYVDAETDDTVGENGRSHDLNFMYVPAKDDEWVHTEENDVKYTVFITNREDVSAADAIGLVDRYSRRWDIEIEYKMIKPLLPSIASKDFRMRYFSFVFSCLLYNIWRLVDHSLKVLVTEAYDDYGRSRWDDRLDPLVTMPDFLASALVLMFCDGGLDPPD
jgi:IS4 transposase